jgi:2-polyprenyl-3-methyl-5-hydroxy-6-metoxy-1,4-benzoquinol methylase
MRNTLSERVARSFDQRSEYFSDESTWSSVDALNNYICTTLIRYISTPSNPFEVLDYGAGNGAVGRLLSEQGIVVDVADLSERMLSLCEFARRKINVTSEVLNTSYDGIILRQVLQYVEESEWEDFMKQIFSHLRVGGALIFSQIVPYCRVDYGFWRDLVIKRRPARLSFPTENEFLLLCEHLGMKIVHFSYSFTRQSLNDWVSRESAKLQEEVSDIINNRTNVIDALWAFEQNGDGDLSWRNKWIHITVKA